MVKRLAAAGPPRVFNYRDSTNTADCYAAVSLIYFFDSL